MHRMLTTSGLKYIDNHRSMQSEQKQRRGSVLHGVVGIDDNAVHDDGGGSVHERCLPVIIGVCWVKQEGRQWVKKKEKRWHGASYGVGEQEQKHV